MPRLWRRREFLELSGWSLAAARAGRGAETRPVRIAFIGVGARGTELLRRILHDPSVDVPAICDIDAAHLERGLGIVAAARGKRPEGYGRGPFDYRRMLAAGGFEAVLVATPQELHAAMSIDSMRSGKFVGAEVPAATTLEECRDLVKASEETRAGYMLLENYCYSRHAMQILTMAEKGIFGDLTYAECAYIHEIRSMRFNVDGTLTWRGRNIAENAGNLYPTHAIGPVSQWMGIHRGDRFVSIATMASKAAATHAYAVEKFGATSPAARVEFRNGDTTNALIRTEKGRLIEIRYDASSPRPSGMGQYSLQGTRGAYESAFGQHKVYVEGRSPAHAWEPLEKYRPEFDHRYWAERGAEASKAGHGGGDYLVLSDFVEAVRTGHSPIDVYDAVAWSAVRPLSAESLAGGSKAVAFPDFRRGSRS